MKVRAVIEITVPDGYNCSPEDLVADTLDGRNPYINMEIKEVSGYIDESAASDLPVQ